MTGATEADVPASASTRAFSDRSNPIFVKELRAALRGRYFRVLFPLTLLVATLIAVLVLVDGGSYGSNRLGRDLFQAMFGCLLVAVTGLVPFSAFLSMGNEWDEHTYDLLVISRLRPLQIALGKLSSAGIEGLLYFSAFTPFLVFAFLLRGIDITSIALLLVGAWIASASTSAVALLLASLGRLRLVRVMLMALLAALLLAANIGANAYVDMHLRQPPAMNTMEEWQALALTYFLLGLPGLLALAAASSGLAHAEENASTAPRVLVTGLLVTLLGIGIWSHLSSPSRHTPMIVGFACALGVALCDLFFVTEAEPLSRRVALFAPRGGVRALFAAPFLPGGGRGFVLFLLHLALCVGAVAAMLAWGPHVGPRAGWEVEAVFCVVVFAGYLVVYLGGVSLLFSGRTRDARTRLVARVLIPVGALISIFAPALLGFLVEDRKWMEMQHPFDPFWVAIASGVEGDDAKHWAVLACVVAVLVLALNAPRVVRGLAEARAAGVERERRAAQTARAGETAHAA
ncbi:MAG: hypothetical protein HZA53_12275 [Planctomycetes bacterium]|nr:hypothetical protein [Planctomycetota bacterium]